MAHGTRVVFATDIGLSVTGIAGPGGGTPEKPVGLTWIGISTPKIEDAFCYTWHGDRAGNKQQSADQALTILIDILKNTKG
jgi:nicotinamide mononucleotide (NMN) deamidase PncC